jgi:hypothetical protein
MKNTLLINLNKYETVSYSNDFLINTSNLRP